MIDCPECRMEERIKQLEEKDRHNSSEHSKFYDKFGAFSLDNQKHEMEIKNISEKLDEIADYVSDKKSQPEKWFDKFGSAIVASIGSMLGTGIMALIVYSILSTLS